MKRNGMNLFRVEKTKVNEEEKFVIVCGKYRASRLEFNTREEAENHIEKQIDWERLDNEWIDTGLASREAYELCKYGDVLAL